MRESTVRDTLLAWEQDRLGSRRVSHSASSPGRTTGPVLRDAARGVPLFVHVNRVGVRWGFLERDVRKHPIESAPGESASADRPFMQALNGVVKPGCVRSGIRGRSLFLYWHAESLPALDMASFGGVDLGRKGAGVFELTSNSDDEEFAYQCENGSVVIVPPSSRYIVVKQCPGAGFGEAYANAWEAANEALDVYFCQLGRPLLLEQKDSTYIVGWKSPSGKTLRIVGRNPLTQRGRARGKAPSVPHNLVTEVFEPIPTLPEVWHESMRYYRVSEASRDLYDSFRNLYLALEALLSYVIPPKKKSNGTAEGDSDWLKRALREVSEAVDLVPYAPASPKGASNAIHKDLYVNLRTAIFHAKTGREVWMPQDWSSRSMIVEARFRYAQMFRALATEYLNISYSFGGWTEAFWGDLLTEGFRDNEMFVSNDRTKLEDETAGKHQLAPAGGTVLKLTMVEAEDLSAERCRGVRGVEAASTVHEALGEVRRFGTLRDGEPMMIECLRAPLLVNDLDELQVVLVVDGRDYGAPRQDFES